MKIIYSCQFDEDLKGIVERLLQKWKTNNSIFQKGEWTTEIQKVLTRGYTSGITFLAVFGKPGQKRVSRVFKVDFLENAFKEATAAANLSKTVASNFFCRIQNHPEKDFWEDETRKKYGIIEYEYAGSMGTTDTVETFLDYFFNQFKKLTPKNKHHDFVNKTTLALDDVIQGLKMKVYTRDTHYNVSVRDVYERKLKHFNLDLVKNLFSAIPDELKGLFTDPQSDYNKINFNLGIGLNAHYTSQTIHGDLNPTNILVYEGHDRIYGTLIDFLEMELKKEEGFTPYFWDFARLEAELILSLFTKSFFDLNQASQILPQLSDSLFNMEPIEDEDLGLTAVSEILINLRRSFFRTEGLGMDISFNSTDVIRSFYCNLQVFYIALLKFKNNPIENYLALAMANIIAGQIDKIDARWVSEKLFKKDEGTAQKVKPAEKKGEINKKPIAIALAVVIAIIVSYFAFSYFSSTTSNKKPDSLQLNIARTIPEPFKEDFKKGNTFFKNSEFKNANKIYRSIIDLKGISKTNNPKMFTILKNRQGLSSYNMALGEKKPNLKIKMLMEAKEDFNLAMGVLATIKTMNSSDMAVILHSMGQVHDELGDTTKNKKAKVKYLTEANKNYNESLKKISKDSKDQSAKIKNSLGKSYLKLAEIKNKKKNLSQALQFLSEAQKQMDKDKYPKEYQLITSQIATSKKLLSNKPELGSKVAKKVNPDKKKKIKKQTDKSIIKQISNRVDVDKALGKQKLWIFNRSPSPIIITAIEVNNNGLNSIRKSVHIKAGRNQLIHKLPLQNKSRFVSFTIKVIGSNVEYIKNVR